MTDENKTEAKAPLQREFRQKGASYMLVLTPIDESNLATPVKTIEVQFGHLATWREGEEEKIAGRYRAIWTAVVDGMEVPTVAMAVQADKAIDQCIRMARADKASSDDYQLDLDDDFFKQKVTAKKVDTHDPWAAEKFAENREELARLASEANDGIETMNNARVNAQGEAIAVAHIVREAADLMGNDRKATDAWARGPEGSNANPALAKLGRGSNALYELMRFAYLSEAQVRALLDSIASGKGVEAHRAASLAAITDDVRMKVEWTDIEAGGKVKADVLPNLNGLETMLRRVAHKAAGIAEAETDAMSMREVVSAFNQTAGKTLLVFEQDYGKSLNTANRSDYAFALMTYGQVTAADIGEGLFADAVERIEAIRDMEDGAEQEKALVKLVNHNMLVKRCVETAWAQRVVLEQQKETRELLQEEEDKPTFSKAARASFGNLSVGAAAARIYEMIDGHSENAAVYKKLQQIVRDTEWTKASQDEAA